MSQSLTCQGWIRASIGAFHLDVAWRVAAGEVLVLYGPSGAGKSLTLRAIAGLLRPDSGHLEVGDTVVYDAKDACWIPPHRRGVGYVPQQYGLFPHLTISENIGYGLAHLPRAQAAERVTHLLATFRLTDLVGQWPHQLSGGEQQRVALARALAPQPKMLLLDEPFSALDAQLRRSLRAELHARLVSWNIPVILVTHDMEEALALGDHVLVMESGRAILEGDPLQVLGQPPSALVASLVGVENLYQGHLLSRSFQNGTMLCQIGDAFLEVPLADVADAAPVTIGFRAGDVLLATQRPQCLSARNVLQGTIRSLEIRSPGVQVTVECGITIRSLVTHQAVAALSLAPGKMVWVVLKTSSCFLVAQDS